MSRSIDQKVVEMKFDNKQFEEAVKQSRQSIKLMEKDINLLEGVKSLKNLDSVIKNVDFSHMIKSIDRIKDSFGIMGTIGRSVVNKLTTDTMGKFNQMTKVVSGTIKNIFNQVYSRGLNRANNLEKSAFKIQGLLDRDKSLKDENQKLEITKKLSDMINDSVTDTAFGLDEASVAASTLATTFGTTDKGLEKVSKTLNAISGVAGTTGAAYQQIADIFTDASGKGVAMANEFNRLSLQGVNAEQEIANYINGNTKLRQKYNKLLKQGQKHTISAADVRDLASKRKISAELFANAFQGYFDTAKKANETLDGVTANIGAAMGRLGALFLRPLVENSGPLVKFLQAVKTGISDIAKILDRFEIPKTIADIINGGLGAATGYLKDFISAFEKGVTPLNDFFIQIKKISDALGIVFQFNADDPYKDMSWGQIFAVESNKKFQESIKERNKTIGNSYKSIKDIKKNFNNTSMKADQKAAAAQEVYLNQMTDGTLKTQDQWKALYTEYYKVQMGYYEMNKKQQKKLLASSDFKNAVKNSAMKEWEEDLWASNKQIDKMAQNQAKIKADDEVIFSYNYLKDILDGIKNVGGAVVEIFKLIGDAVFGTIGPFNDFYKMITGNPKEARKSLNNLSKGFKEATEKFKEFIKNNEGVKAFISNIGKYIRIFAKLIEGVVKIVAHLAVALAPLASRIADIIGGIFNTIRGDGTAGISIFDVVVKAVCGAIDFLANVLENVWGILEGLFGWLANIGVIDFLKKVAGAILSFAKTALSNWPEAWDMIKNGLKGFTEWAKVAFQWIGKKLKPVLSVISPYVAKFADKVYELTNGFINLRKPLSWIGDLLGTTTDETKNVSSAVGTANTALEKMGNTAEKVSGSVGKIKASFASFTGFDKKGLFGSDGFSDMFDAEESGMSSISEMLGGSKSNTQSEEKAKGPFAWIINLASWLKEQFSKISSEEVQGTLNSAIKMLIGVAAVIATLNISKGIKDIGKGFKNIGSIISGNDITVERRKALSGILKNIALLIATFVAGVVVISVAVWALGKIPEKQLMQGIKAILTIGGMIAVFVIVIAALSSFLQGKTKLGSGSTMSDSMFRIGGIFGKSSSEISGPAEISTGAYKALTKIAVILGMFIAGVLLIAREAKRLGEMNPDQLQRGMDVIEKIATRLSTLIFIVLLVTAVVSSEGGPITGQNLKSFGTVLIGIAAIIAVFTVSIKVIIDLMIKTASKIETVKPEALENSMLIFAGIASAILIVVAVIMVLTTVLLTQSQGLSDEKNKTVVKVLGMCAVLIFVLGLAIGGIIRNMAILITASKIGNMRRSAEIIKTIMVNMMIIIGLILAAVVLLAATVSSYQTNSAAMTKMIGMLGLIAVIIFVLGLAIGSILRNIASMAVTLNIVKPRAIKATVDIIKTVMSGLAAFIGVTMVAVGIISSVPTTDSKKMIAGLAMVVAISAILGGIIFAIGYAAESCRDVKASVLSTFIPIIAVVGGVLAAIIGIAAYFSTAPTFNEKAALALTAFVGSLGFLFIAIGVCIAIISAADISDKTIGVMVLVTVVVVALIAIAAVVGKYGSGTGTGALTALTAFVVGLGLLFAMIGLSVLFIGKGVDLLSNGILKLIAIFNTLSDEKVSSRFKKGAKQLGSAFGEFLDGIVDGIIEFGKKVDKKKPQLVNAIKNISGIIRAGASTALQEVLGFILDRLGDIIDAIAAFLEEHKDDLLSILISLEDILIPALDHLMDLIIQYAPDTLFKLMDALEKYTPEFVQKAGKWIAKTIDELVVSLNDNMGTIVNAIHNLLKTVVNAIFMFFGMDPIFTDIETQAAKESKSMKEIGDDTIAEMGKSFDIDSNDPKIGWVGKFVGAIAQGIWNAVINNQVIKDAADKISQIMWELTGLEERYNRVMGALSKTLSREQGISAEIAEVNRQIAAQNRMSVKDYEATGGFEEFWKSETGKIKLVGILLRNNLRKYEDVMKLYKKQLGDVSEETWNRWVKIADNQRTQKILEQGAKNLDNGINRATQSHSPSRLFANSSGKNIGDGIILGIEESINSGAKTIGDTTVSTVSSSLASAQSGVNQATNRFSEGLKPMSFGDMLSESFSGVGEKMRKTLDESGLFGDAFTIKPKVDLSNIEGSKDSIQGIFDNMGLGVNVDGASNMFSSLKTGNFSSIDVSSLASGFDSANSNTSNDFSSGTQNTNITFNQNNFSPESLSSIDIYRQTESLLGSNSTVNGIMNAIGVKSSDVKFSF